MRMRVVAIESPGNYRKLLGKLPSGVEFSNQPEPNSRFIHLFVTRRSDLKKQLPRLRAKLADDGILWVSWPKKSSRVTTDMSEDIIRDIALPLGLVDTKVCAIDDTWSGLKLLIRCENRQPKNFSK